MVIRELLARVAAEPNCLVRQPAGMPQVSQDFSLPQDLLEFYELCGGLDLFRGADFGISISSPEELKPSNLVILGESFPEDISHSWFIVAHTVDREHLSIDLSRERAGRCYDSFHETHGIAGSSPVIANSFSELLGRLLDSRGGHWYWLSPEFEELGDAYD